MEQLLCHFIGDYWLQNDWMAMNKKKQWFPAIIHGIIYTLPFLILTRSILALAVICITHILIDHTNIVGKLNQIKNWNFKPFKMGYFQPKESGLLVKSSIILNDGYSDRPFFIRVWLIIIQDNILHLLINYLALLYC